MSISDPVTLKTLERGGRSEGLRVSLVTIIHCTLTNGLKHRYKYSIKRNPEENNFHPRGKKRYTVMKTDNFLLERERKKNYPSFYGPELLYISQFRGSHHPKYFWQLFACPDNTLARDEIMTPPSARIYLHLHYKIYLSPCGMTAKFKILHSRETLSF